MKLSFGRQLQRQLSIDQLRLGGRNGPSWMDRRAPSLISARIARENVGVHPSVSFGTNPITAVPNGLARSAARVSQFACDSNVDGWTTDLADSNRGNSLEVQRKACFEGLKLPSVSAAHSVLGTAHKIPGEPRFIMSFSFVLPIVYCGQRRRDSFQQAPI
jgi:hypothetical protein